MQNKVVSMLLVVAWCLFYGRRSPFYGVMYELFHVFIDTAASNTTLEPYTNPAGPFLIN